ncbi:hypothetical protein CRG98_039316 [Punica granatum]|uniref:DUF8040 domain-containing protein n=1 Tax=Punica granatum TaxID=22663 RepID=A0A2I0I8I8_PUNGR|nr:hypothetical protein CRG98_039316 [Punica granatum]
MAPKGDGILEWTDAFIDVLLEKFTRTHTTSWKGKDWEQMNKELEEQFPSTTLGSKKLQQKLQPPKSPATYACIEEEFLAAATIRGKEPVNLEEGSGDSDDPVHEVTEPVVTVSRRQVRRRSYNADSRLQECLDMLKYNMSRREKERNCTPPTSKRSKSATSPEKPAAGSIEESMAEGITVEEMVGMFLMVVAHSTRLSVVAERFWHSKETVSRLIKNCIGAIDGTHVATTVPSSLARTPWSGFTRARQTHRWCSRASWLLNPWDPRYGFCKLAEQTN